MGNMSYCRFENTANDLDDCLQAIEDGKYKDLNSYERGGLSSLLTLCERVLEYKDEIEETLNNK
tara:strand:+ start:89 stop:280 length:192 start_codon:yes stop_codon:yes gene_type:complete